MATGDNTASPSASPIRRVKSIKNDVAKADKIVQMSNVERKEYLRNAEVIDVKPNPHPGTNKSFVVTLADGTQGIFKPERGERTRKVSVRKRK